MADHPDEADREAQHDKKGTSEFSEEAGRRYQFGDPAEFSDVSPTEDFNRSRGERLPLGKAVTRLCPDRGPNAPTFCEFADCVYADYVEALLPVRVQHVGRELLDAHLKPFFRAKRIDEITRRTVENCKCSMLVQGVSRETVVKSMVVLERILLLAQESGYVSERSSAHLQEWSVDFLDFEETDRLLKAAKTFPDFHFALLTALNTGMFDTELLALHWRDVDLSQEQIHVQRHIHEGEVVPVSDCISREIDLPDQLVQYLSEYRDRQKAETPFVFSAEAGKQLDRKIFDDQLANACKEAALRRINWDDLRLTYACHLASLDVPWEMIVNLLGNDSPQMPETAVDPTLRRQAVKTLDSREALRR